MIITDVAVSNSHWELRCGLGETLRLSRASASEQPFRIGTIGTRRALAQKGNLTERIAQTLAELRMPIMLVDVRRKGMGGSGSWGPTEFATVIPRYLHDADAGTYSFHHVPLLSPSLPLLESSRKSLKNATRLHESEIEAAVQQVLRDEQPAPAAWKHWQVFQARYRREILNGPAVLAARAFVEAARERGGIAIFLCAEERRVHFDNLTQDEQDGCYCHRFTLAREVARSIQRDFPGAAVIRVDLAIGEQPTETRLA